MSNGNPIRPVLNGEAWRIITPLILMILTGMSSFSMYMLNDIKLDITGVSSEVIKNRDRQIVHISDPNMHGSLRSRIEVLEKQVNNI